MLHTFRLLLDFTKWLFAAFVRWGMGMEFHLNSCSTDKCVFRRHFLMKRCRQAFWLKFNRLARKYLRLFTLSPLILLFLSLWEMSVHIVALAHGMPKRYWNVSAAVQTTRQDCHPPLYFLMAPMVQPLPVQGVCWFSILTARSDNLYKIYAKGFVATLARAKESAMNLICILAHQPESWRRSRSSLGALWELWDVRRISCTKSRLNWK